MNETTDAIAIFAPIWRRKWLILAVGIVVAAASYFYYKRQRPTFQSTTQIFLGAAAEEQAPTERSSSKNRNSSLSDQAAVINTIVVEQVRNRLRKEGKAELAKSAKVKAKSPEKSEFITITAEAHTAKGTALLANLTAESYIKRQKDKRQRAIEKAIAISRRQLRRIEQAALAKAEKPTTKKKAANGSEAAPAESAARPQQAASSVIQEANLSSKINQLESSLGTVSAQQVKRAKPSGAQRLSPKPRKDAIFGFVLGLVLAALAAYAFSRFDRRLRGLSRIEAVTGLPLLSAMPKVRRPIVRGGSSSPRPSVHLLEPLRRLQAALQMSDAPGGFPAVGGAMSTPAPPPLPGSPPVPVGVASPAPALAGAYAPGAAPPIPGAAPLSGPARDATPGSQGRPRVILFVSPDPGDGKSTILADLALVQRDAGERVVIVEANFRRPVQSRLLGVEQDGRLAGMLTGRLDFDAAAARVLPAVSPSEHSRADDVQHGVATAVQAEAGSLFVLGGDASVPNPPALLAQQATAELLRSLAGSFDSVLIDAPSPLEVSDVIPLLGIVDRIVVVARVGHSREASAQRLRELLEHPSSAPVAGVVANFVASGELKRYGFSSLNGRVGRLTGR